MSSALWSAVETLLFPPLVPAPGPDPRSATAEGDLDALTSALRHRLRLLAADKAGQEDPEALHRAAAPLVEQARLELGRAWCRGESRRRLGGRWSRLLDAAVLEGFRLARFQAGLGSIVTPVTVVAIGAYGDQALLPEDTVELLLLVPPGRRELEGRRMGHHLISNLRTVGLTVEHSTCTAAACVAFARDEPRVRDRLSSGRHLTGSYGPWAMVRERTLG